MTKQEEEFRQLLKEHPEVYPYAVILVMETLKLKLLGLKVRNA